MDTQLSSLPAVFIGGPPHSGKSILSARLTRALRLRQIEHYLLRASPDGEGSWLYSTETARAAELRQRAKTDWTTWLSARLAQDVTNRQLPLLVDGGGKITDEVRAIAERCTHAIVIAAQPAACEEWAAFVASCGLAPIALLQSVIDGIDTSIQANGVLRGTITGLTNDRRSDGPTFHALLDALTERFDRPPESLFATHAAATDIDLVLHIERPIFPLPAHGPDRPWLVAELPTLLANVPAGVPLAIYGVGPIWLLAALACHAAPERCALFDARSGWVETLTLRPGAPGDATLLRIDPTLTDAAVRLHIDIPGSYFAVERLPDLALPALPPARGVIIDGKLPTWLAATIARSYAAHPWVALYQPPLQQGIIIGGTDRARHGAIVPMEK